MQRALSFDFSSNSQAPDFLFDVRELGGHLTKAAVESLLTRSRKAAVETSQRLLILHQEDVAIEIKPNSTTPLLSLARQIIRKSYPKSQLIILLRNSP